MLRVEPYTVGEQKNVQSFDFLIDLFLLEAVVVTRAPFEVYSQLPRFIGIILTMDEHVLIINAKKLVLGLFEGVLA